MKRIFLFILLTLSGPANCDTPRKLVFFGDSLTAGLGVSLEQAYPALIAEKLKAKHSSITVVNAGSSGDTTGAGLRRIDWVLKQKPTWVVLALGGNDMLRAIPTSDTERNLKAMIEKVKAANAQPIIFGMRATPNLGKDYTAPFDSLFKKVGTETHVPVLDFYIQPIAGKREFLQADGLHPTVEGQKKIAEFIWPFLEKEFRP